MKFTEFATMSDVEIEMNKTQHIENTPFTAVDVKGGFILTVGNQCVTNKIYENVEELKKYAKKPNWDTMGTVMCMIAEQAMKKVLTESIEFKNEIIEEKNNA